MRVTDLYVIAEIGVNHDGSLDKARLLIDAAAGAGADAVKFQTFRPAELAARDAPLAGYQAEQVRSGGQREMLSSLALDEGSHGVLLEHARLRGIDFLSSPFDLPSADFLIDRLGLPVIKVGSGEITNGPLLYRIAQSGRALILSTGMATFEEIDEALGVLAHGYALGGPPRARRDLARAWRPDEVHEVLQQRVTLLHCTTAYPCPASEANLRLIPELHARFGLDVGFSDHTSGTHVAAAAVALGARILEKHVTLDRTSPGPDHRASVEPDELATFVAGARSVYEALGSGRKVRTRTERANAPTARKGLVARRPIRRGEAIAADAIAARRPEIGRSPMDYWDVVGSVSPTDVDEDQPIP